MYITLLIKDTGKFRLFTLNDIGSLSKICKYIFKFETEFGKMFETKLAPYQEFFGEKT
jgi:hypothetical protein